MTRNLWPTTIGFVLVPLQIGGLCLNAGLRRNSLTFRIATSSARRGTFSFPPKPLRDAAMTKERKSQREAKKKPGMTLKEKRTAKKSKQEAKGIMGSTKPA